MHSDTSASGAHDTMDFSNAALAQSHHLYVYYAPGRSQKYCDDCQSFSNTKGPLHQRHLSGYLVK